MRLLAVGHPCPDLTTAMRIATERGALVRQRRSAAEALDELREGRGADLLFLDVMLDVPEIVAMLHAEHIHLPIVAYGINADPARAVAAIKAGAREFLTLPPDPQAIALVLATLADARRDLISVDPAMAGVLDLARRFAPSDASVLITGESGTGKEVVARFVHRESRRAAGPFVSVNCAAIPDNLLESELFGHEKGAFTGATARRIGRFEEASGGTLLLDEISEMDVRLQAKLLRAIQEREIDRVGGSHGIKVDLRILATSNRDLERTVAAGGFREDLYFRLNVVTLQLPPLRERPQDVAALARHFIEKYATLNGLAVAGLTAAAEAMRLGHRWPGNVRELENCLHRAVLLTRQGRVDRPAIMLGPTGPETREAGPRASAGLVGRKVGEVERDLILETLQHTSGNRTHAAAMLGISIRTLRNKLHEYVQQGTRVPAPYQEAAREGAVGTAV